MEKREKDRKKDDCRRARPRETGASEVPAVSGIIKGDEGSAINGSARRNKVTWTWLCWASTFSKKQQKDPKVT